jgi:pantetheine-phosphate adenylyltransferase
MERKALYPGSFDPITNGHLDIIIRAMEIFDRLIVGVGLNISKTPLFSVDERIEMIRESIAGIPNVEVVSYSGLTAKYAEQIGAVALIRGLRAVSDFEYEFQMTLANRQLFPKGETVFLMPSIANVYLNSSMVKDIASLGGDIERFVPPPVAEKLRAKFTT